MVGVGRASGNVFGSKAIVGSRILQAGLKNHSQIRPHSDLVATGPCRAHQACGNGSMDSCFVAKLLCRSRHTIKPQDLAVELQGKTLTGLVVL